MDLAGRRAERRVRAESRRRYREWREDIAAASGAAVAGPTQADEEIRSGTESTVGYEMQVPAQADGEYELIPEDEVVAIEVRRWEGPFAGQPRDDGKPNDYMKIHLLVHEGEYKDIEFSTILDARIGQKNKTRAAFEAALNRDLEEGERLDFDDLLSKRCRALVGQRTSGQGGVFNNVKQWMRPAPRRQPRNATAEQWDEVLADGEAKAAHAQRGNQPAGRAG